ncbi:ATP/GTP-binding protein [Streptomyces sp. NPDC052107]|uniref:ATP/GTP-binding protein n=1 Tax=Streptomyces sp. NPDC052107 TaxID=3155632 RepID=UPI00342A9A75
MALFVGAATLTAAVSPAAADDGPVIGGGCRGASSWVTVCVQKPGTPGSSGKNQGPGKQTGNGEKAGPQLCAEERLDPQPPASDPVWKGHKPGNGAIYTRVCVSDVVSAAAGNLNMGMPWVPQVFWAAQAPAANVDPEQLAREAVDRMLLTGPDIASPHAAGRYVVGMPMWLWVRPSPTTYGPNTASASLAGVTVTATAKVAQINWQMGDGSRVTCKGPGTPYADSYGKQDSPTCGHTYNTTSADQENGKYTVSATATWTVNWQDNAAGETGQFNETRQSQVQVAIGEVQVVR